MKEEEIERNLKMNRTPRTKQERGSHCFWQIEVVVMCVLQRKVRSERMTGNTFGTRTRQLETGPRRRRLGRGTLGCKKKEQVEEAG